MEFERISKLYEEMDKNISLAKKSEVKLASSEVVSDIIEKQNNLIKKIVNIKTEEAFLLLSSYLQKDQHSYTRSAVAYGLGLLGNKKAVEPLLLILKKERQDAGLLYNVVQALGMLGDERAVQPLIDILDELGYLDDTDYWNREKERAELQRQIAFGSDDQKRKLETKFAELLRASNLRSFVARPHSILISLTQIGDKRAIEIFLRLVKTNIMTEYAISGLGSLANKEVLPMLYSLLNDTLYKEQKELVQKAIDAIKQRDSTK